MYYCINCGFVTFYNRPDVKEKSTKAYLEIECIVCGSEKGFRKVLPEYFRAANLDEFDRFVDTVKDHLEIIEPEEEDY